MNLLTQTQIAILAHAANVAYCEATGDVVPPSWGETDEAHRQSLLAGVAMYEANPEASPEAAHEAWMERKLAEGWTHGAKKNIKQKKHHCLLPYNELPIEQRVKDHLFRSIVLTGIGFEAGDEDTEHLKANCEAMGAELELVADALNRAGVGPGYENLGEAIDTLVDSLKLSIGNTGKPEQCEQVPIGFIVVRYIGRRDEYEDRLYQTGLHFKQGQMRALPQDIARRFLKHGDLFERAADESLNDVELRDDATDVAISKVRKQQRELDDEINRVMDIKDSVTRMESSDLAAFAQEHFRMELDSKRPSEELRTEVLALIDQFGVI